MTDATTRKLFEIIAGFRASCQTKIVDLRNWDHDAIANDMLGIVTLFDCAKQTDQGQNMEAMDRVLEFQLQSLRASMVDERLHHKLVAGTTIIEAEFLCHLPAFMRPAPGSESRILRVLGQLRDVVAPRQYVLDDEKYHAWASLIAANQSGDPLDLIPPFERLLEQQSNERGPNAREELIGLLHQLDHEVHLILNELINTMKNLLRNLQSLEAMETDGPRFEQRPRVVEELEEFARGVQRLAVEQVRRTRGEE